jgi:hypothetical protein
VTARTIVQEFHPLLSLFLLQLINISLQRGIPFPWAKAWELGLCPGGADFKHPLLTNKPNKTSAKDPRSPEDRVTYFHVPFHPCFSTPYSFLKINKIPLNKSII